MVKTLVYLRSCAMPVFPRESGTEFTTHGATFTSYVSPGRGRTQLCGWRLTVPPDLAGVAHRPSREEIVLVLDGRLRLTLDGLTSELRSGDVALVPAGAELRVDGGPEGLTAWVTTTPWMTATTADGTTITPPWAQ
jgi:quercetin dioxygenase-like cupin family protein